MDTTGRYKYLTVVEGEGLGLFAARVREALGDNLTSLKLFGSKARGDFDAESDIDILVLVKSRDWDLHYRVCNIANDIALEYGINISPVIIAESEYDLNREHGTAFYESVEREGILV